MYKKPLHMTGFLIRKYRNARGWILKENAQRGISLLDKIEEIFGERMEPTLTSNAIRNMESQDEKRHREPTPQELYQIARALEVPMMALIIDVEDPYGTCPFAPIGEDNCKVLAEQIIAEECLTAYREAWRLKCAVEIELENCVFKPSYGFPNVLTQEQMKEIQSQARERFRHLAGYVFSVQIKGIGIPPEIIKDIRTIATLLQKVYDIDDLNIPKFHTPEQLTRNRRDTHEQEYFDFQQDQRARREYELYKDNPAYKERILQMEMLSLNQKPDRMAVSHVRLDQIEELDWTLD